MTTRVTEGARRSRFSRLAPSSLNARADVHLKKKRDCSQSTTSLERSIGLLMGFRHRCLFLSNKDTHVSSVSSLSLVLFSRD